MPYYLFVSVLYRDSCWISVNPQSCIWPPTQKFIGAVPCESPPPTLSDPYQIDTVLPTRLTLNVPPAFEAPVFEATDSPLWYTYRLLLLASWHESRPVGLRVPYVGACGYALKVTSYLTY